MSTQAKTLDWQRIAKDGLLTGSSFVTQFPGTTRITRAHVEQVSLTAVENGVVMVTIRDGRDYRLSFSTANIPTVSGTNVIVSIPSAGGKLRFRPKAKL